MANYTYTPVGQDSYFDCSTYSDYVFASITNNSESPLTISTIRLYLSSGKGTFTAGSKLTGNGESIKLQVGITNSSDPASASYYVFSSNSHTITNTVTPTSGGWPDYGQMTSSYSFDCSTSIPAKTTYYLTWHIFTKESSGNVFCWDYHVESVEIETKTSSSTSITEASIKFTLSGNQTVLYNNPSGVVSVSDVKVTLPSGTDITNSVICRYSYDGGRTYKEATSSGFGYVKKETIVEVKVRAQGDTSKGYSGTVYSGTKTATIKCKLRPPTIDSFTSGASTSPIMYGTAHTLQCKASTNPNSPSGVDTQTFGYPTESLPGTSPQTTYTARAQSTKPGYVSSDTVTKQLTVTYKLRPPTSVTLSSSKGNSVLYETTTNITYSKITAPSSRPSDLDTMHEELKVTSDDNLSTVILADTSVAVVVVKSSTLVTGAAYYKKDGYTSSDKVSAALRISCKLNPPVWNISWQNEKKYYPNYSFTCYSEFVYTLSSTNPADLSPEYQRLWYDDDGNPKKTPSGEEDWEKLSLEGWKTYTKSLFVQGKSGLVSVKARYTKTGYTSSEYTRQLIHVCYSPRCSEYELFTCAFQVQNGSSFQNITKDASYDKNREFKVSWSAFPVSSGIGRFNHYQIDLLKMNNSVIEKTFTLKEDENDPSKSKEVVLNLSQKVSGTYRLKLTCICKTNSGSNVYDNDTGVVLTGDFKILSPPSFTVLYPVVGNDTIWYTMNPQARVIFQNNSPDGITNLSVSVNGSSYPYQTNSLHYFSKEDLKPQLSEITSTQKIDFTSPEGSISSGPQKFSITMTNSVGSFTKEFTLNLLSFSYQIKSNGKAAYVVHLTDYLDHVLSNYTKYYQGSSAKSLLTDQNQVQHEVIKQKPFIDTLNALKTLYKNVSEDSVPPSSLFRDLSKIDLSVSPKKIRLESDSTSASDPPSFTIWEEEGNYLPIGNYFNYILYILKNML